MESQPLSRNFDFLLDYDPLLVEYVARAELTAYSDPNTSLIKTRQFGEWLSKCVASHAGMDCIRNSYEETIGLLKRQRIVPQDVFWLFDQVRLYGNEAAHEHKREPTAALQSLICAYELSKWFKVEVVGDAAFAPPPFRPPPKPDDATAELREEIDYLRDEVAKSQLAADASEEQIKALSQQLERDARDHQEGLGRMQKELAAREHYLARLQSETKTRLHELVEGVGSKTFQSFVERSKASAQRLGTHRADHLPLTQLRISTGESSSCCRSPMILVQSMQGGFITKNCAKCNNKSTLARHEFYKLHVCVICADCGKQAEPTYVGYNYGYQCECGWKCELAALVPSYTDS